jgi:hypothetical protein
MQTLRCWTNWRHEDQCTLFIISRSVLLGMKNISDKSCRETRNTRFGFKNTFFRKLFRLWGNEEEYCRAGQATKAHGACALHAGHLRLANTLRLCNIHCFSTAAMVVLRGLSVMFYVHCLSCPAWYGIKILNGFHKVLVITRCVHGKFVVSIRLPLIT